MENTKTAGKITNFSKGILRIERSYKDLLQFKTKLNSYLCEPTTYKQYKSREELSEKINNLIKSHQELLDYLKNNNFATQPDTRINDSLQEAKLVEERVGNYILSINA